MYFVNKEDIKFKYNFSEINGIEAEIIEHYIRYKDEICYIMKDDSLYGIVSTGDILRWNNEQTVSFINLNFKYIESVDFACAKDIFDKSVNVRELPVIMNGHFIGVIKSGEEMPNRELEHSRKLLKKVIPQQEIRKGRMIWINNSIEKIISKLNAKIFLYNMPEFDEIKTYLSEKDKALYVKKLEYVNPNIWTMSEKEKFDFFPNNTSTKEMEVFFDDFRKIQTTMTKGIYKIDDISSKNFNFKDGYRYTTNIPQQTHRKIFVFGPCLVQGTFVSDDQTIGSYLQKFLIEHNYIDYEVINCGIGGNMGDFGWSRVASEEIGENDIVIIFGWFSDELLKKFPQSIYKGSLSNVYLNIKEPIKNIFNYISHCNYVINYEIAKTIYNDLSSLLTTEIDDTVQIRRRIQDYYISWDVVAYFRMYMIENNLKKYEDKKIGAIVMNCNPFTKGHRYLIEKASAQVDLLYVFVVEEDKSVFAFNDRIEMVRQGTNDIENVKVLPSGKYIISEETFSQYFEKDHVKQIDDMDYDIHIFGEVIAKELNITVRFVGEEPFDRVTHKYNDTMKKILPKNGIDVVEIPRKCIGDNVVISASKVRKAIEEGDNKMLAMMLPDTTLQYLHIVVS